ncbi:hypothetical protein BJI57_09155 [Acinetobacter baumannii]|nr:hypothetical protein BJI57_09155 [Acinetobacter baumannii]
MIIFDRSIIVYLRKTKKIIKNNSLKNIRSKKELTILKNTMLCCGFKHVFFCELSTIMFSELV